MLPTLMPVTDVKRHATDIIGRLQENRVPVLITERGREAAVLLDVGTYRGMLNRMDLLEAIAKGEQAFRDGKVVSQRVLAAELKGKWG